MNVFIYGLVPINQSIGRWIRLITLKCVLGHISHIVQSGPALPCVDCTVSLVSVISVIYLYMWSVLSCSAVLFVQLFLNVSISSVYVCILFYFILIWALPLSGGELEIVLNRILICNLNFSVRLMCVVELR